MPVMPSFILYFFTSAVLIFNLKKKKQKWRISLVEVCLSNENVHWTMNMQLLRKRAIIAREGVGLFL
jgi:hypothetical protein